MSRSRNRSQRQVHVVERFTLSASGRLRRMASLGVLGVSVGAGIFAPGCADAGGIGSAAWFSQMGAAGAMPAGVAPRAAGGALVAGALTPSSPAEAKILANRSLQDLANALSAMNAAASAQQLAASQALAQASAVPDGLVAGGLQPSALASGQGDSNACIQNGQCAWVNATLPSQTQTGGKDTVTVTQNAGKAILSWDSFNIGPNTTLHIDQTKGTQSDGQNDWIALNRVVAGTSPSVIQGEIQAEGTIYILNQNGVLFDAGSQVNVNSLVVSSLPLYMTRGAASLRSDDPAYLTASAQDFLNIGLASVRPDDPNGVALGLSPVGAISVDGAAALPAALPGDVSLNPGATISVSNNGYAIIAAPNVYNAGWIEATDSQVIVAAGLGVGIALPSGGNGRFGVQVSGSVFDTHTHADLTPDSRIDNTGLITSARGSVTLQAGQIDQNGVIEATTSVNSLGSIALDADETVSGVDRPGSLRLEPGSVTTILPDSANVQTNSTPAATQLFQPLGISLSGGAVTLESGALVEAPGHKVSINAVVQGAGSVNALLPGEVAGRVYVAPDAVVDVSGLADITEPLSSVLITIPRVGLNELADSPLQRTGPLYGASITIDSRITGTRSDGLQWVGTPLADLTGYVQQVSRGVQQLLTNAGSISLAGNEVIARAGSQLVLAGGYIDLLGGYVTTTHLLAANGSVVDIADANPNVQYVGFAGDTAVAHPRWNSTTLYENPLLASMLSNVYEPEDVIGGSAGTLTVSAITSSVIASTIDGHSVFGSFQAQQGTQPIGATVVFSGSTNPLSQYGPSFVLTNADPESYLPAGFGAGTILPVRGSDYSNTGDLGWWTPVSTAVLAGAGVGSVRIIADTQGALNLGGEVVVNPDVQLAVTPGGSIDLSGSRVTIGGSLSAPAGSISVIATGQTSIAGTTVQAAGVAAGDYLPGNIVLGAGASLNTSGLFVNDAGKDAQDLAGSAYVNGGSISLTTDQASHVSMQGQQIPTTDADGNPTFDTVYNILDLTGSILLGSGSQVAANSGAYVSQAGQLLRKNNVVVGNGGNIALQTYVYSGAPFGRSDLLPLPKTFNSSGVPSAGEPSAAGQLVLGGAVTSYGFTTGGALTLRAPGIQIGGSALPGQPETLQLRPAFFADNGFGSFNLASEYNATISSGTDLVLQQMNLLPVTASKGQATLASAPTGTALFGSDGLATSLVTLGSLDTYHRKPVNLTLQAGDYLTWGEQSPSDPNLITPPDLSASGITGTLLLDAGARIDADPGADITLESINQLTVLGDITAHGGNVVLSVDTAGGGYAQNPGFLENGTAYSSSGKSVWLGAASVVDVSGTTVIDQTDPDATGVPLGRVLNGGNVTITADSGYVIAVNCTDVACPTTSPAGQAGTAGAEQSTPTVTPLFSNNGGGSGGGGGSGSGGSTTPASAPGAEINVSGTQGTVGVLYAGTLAPQSSSIASNAGTVTIGAANGLYFHGQVLGQAGGGSAEGGTLVITPETGVLQDQNQATPAATLLNISANPVAMPTGALTPGAAVTSGSPSGVLYFSTSLLTGSGITSLALGTDPSIAVSAAPVPIDFTSSVNLLLGRSLTLNTLNLDAAPPAPKSADGKPAVLTIALSAPYVGLHGYIPGGSYTNTSNWPITRIDNDVFNDNPNGNIWTNVARAKLSIVADTLDIGGQVALDYYNSVSMTADQDLRFVTPPAYSEINAGGGTYLSVPAILQVSANLTMAAPRIYPATGNSAFIIVDNAYQYEKLTGQKDSDGNPITQSVLVPSTATVTFERLPSPSGGDETPLSVGGRLVVDAVSITQDGALYAPDGQIVLGVTTNPDFDPNASTLTQYPTGPTSVDYALPFNDPSITLADGSTEDVILRTKSVEFGSNSVTSVSLNGLTVPYGTNLDGLNPTYNPSGNSAATPATLTQGPAKGIAAIAANVSVDQGAVVDLRGGGDLVSTEWVAGTGGSRNVLAQYNVSYANGTPASVPLYADGRAIYAILPGYSGTAPFDPEFASAPLVGQSVYLSGMPGLPAGNYVLLPAQYALLPGAFRLVQDTSSAAQGTIASVTNQVLPDGTLQVSGYFADSLDGARAALTTTFLVQGGSTWRQYSEYDLTSLNGYFAAQSAKNNTQLSAPGDGGTLALAVASLTTLDPATQKDITISPSMTLVDGTVEAATPQGLNGADLQIAAPLLQVISGDAAPLKGFLQLEATTLNSFGASRIVLGATTSDFLGIETFDVGANKVDVSTFGAPLQAAEIVLAAQTNTVGDGIVVDGGAKLQAVGQATGRDGLQIDIGAGGSSSQINPATGLPIDTVSGDGAFLQLSVNNPNVPSRDAVPGMADGGTGAPLGSINIGANASLVAPGSITFDSTAVTSIQPSAQLQTGWLLADSNQVRIAGSDAGAGAQSGLVIGPSLQAQLAAIDHVTLESGSAIAFDAGTSLSAGSILELNAGLFTVAGGAASISAPEVEFGNTNAVASPAPAAGTAALNVAAGTVSFGAAGEVTNFIFSGISNLDIKATDAVLSAGSGTVGLGQAALSLETPQVLAMAGSDLTIETSGSVNATADAPAAAVNRGFAAAAASGANPAAGAAANPGFGGRLSFTGAAIDWNIAMAAPAGVIGMSAQTGDLILGSQARLSTAGAPWQAFDASVAMSGGQISLSAAQGGIQMMAGSSLDVSAGGAGASAGSVRLSAPQGAVDIAGTLRGQAGTPGEGGKFSIDSGAPVDLDQLSTLLSTGGFDGAIDVHTRSGDLALASGYTLDASAVTLTADTTTAGAGGTITIDGAIDASGTNGGTVTIYGANGVSLNGSIQASAQSASGNGGYVELGVGATGNGTLGALGQQNFTSVDAGVLAFGSGASIDVTAGASAEQAGSVLLRVPVLVDGTIPLQGASSVRIAGTGQPVVEAFARWVASSGSTSGLPYFDGVLDPAGSTGGAAGAARASFVDNTLAGFIINPGWDLSLPATWKARAGIELVNADTSVNGGAITLASAWNLAAGSIGANGDPQLLLRTDGVAPAITLRGVGNINIEASLTDGFFQTVNPFSQAPLTNLNNSIAPVATASNPLPIATATLLGLQSGAGGAPYDSSSFRIVAGADIGSAAPLSLDGQSSGSVVVSGEQTAASPVNPGLEFILPTVIRTGVGRIDIAATGNLSLADAQAPAAIYTAGFADVVGAAPIGTVLPKVAQGYAPTLLAPQAQPQGAGDITISVGGNIVGVGNVVDGTGGRTGNAGTDLTQYWWPWMQNVCFLAGSNCAQATQSNINFGMFAQGVLSTGGNVDVSAGGSITNLSVSLPTTWTLAQGGGGTTTVETLGGGNLSVTAGQDIVGGAYFVGRGTAAIHAGLDLTSASDSSGNSEPVLLALQDAQFTVSAGRNVDIGGVFDPSYLFQGFDSQAYSAASAVNIVAEGGAMTFGSLSNTPGSAYDSNGAAGIVSPVATGLPDLLPATLSIAVPDGSLNVNRGGELFPSAQGDLSLLAEGTIQLINRPGSPVNREFLGLIDAPADLLPSVSSPVSSADFNQSFIRFGSESNQILHDTVPLHASDSVPLQIYSVMGSIVDGDNSQVATGVQVLQTYDGSMQISADKPAEIRAGLDIVNLSFTGQNLYASDVTTISAGRDLYDPPLMPALQVPVIELGGPGTLVVEAGRDLGPLTSADAALTQGYLPIGDPQYPGIYTVGNANDFYLPRQGANIAVRFGDGPGMNTDAFANLYIDPSVLHDPQNPADSLGTPSYSAQLLSFVQQYIDDEAARTGNPPPAALTAAEAWTTFQSMPLEQRQLLVGEVFLDILNQVGLDYNGTNSSTDRFIGQYGRGYKAIEELFPSASGYTQNAQSGGTNGAVSKQQTGNFDMRGSTVQTDAGGNISVLGPGGEVLVGSESAPPFLPASGGNAAVGPDSEGILTLETGAISIFSDASVLLAQSRIFTEQGGDLLIWSSNGDINAGKGAKTSSEIPPQTYTCDNDLFCLVDAKSEVSGAGIAVLQTKPGTPSGSANLVAPVGTVDAGDAGIRVSGNLNVAALHVANADNIQVQGSKTGVPTGVVDTSAVSIANSVAAAVTQSADAMAAGRRAEAPDLELFVDVLVPPEEQTGQ